MITREQKYALQIYAQVEDLKQNSTEKKCKEYGSMAHKLPILIRTAGLVQALAFLDTPNRKESQQKLLDHISVVTGHGDRVKLLNKSRSAPLLEYMRLSQEVMAALLWYKRFAQSILGVDSAVDDESTAEKESEREA